MTVELEGGQQAMVEKKFSYEAPVVDSYHPRNGPPRGGFWVTITGRNFGYLDTSPVASIAGHICLETYWMSNTQIVARGAPGVGGPSMLHHIDITFEAAEHVQEMPRRLRNWVRSVLQKSAFSVSAKHNASKPLVEIDLKAASDPAGKALARAGDKKAAGSKPKKPSTATNLVERKVEWQDREREVKAELAESKVSAREEEMGLLATYLERVEDRDREREQQEQAERVRRLAEYQAVLDAEKKLREEEAAAAKAKQEQEELRRTLDKGSVEKKLDKFSKAREAARKKKVASDANAALAAAKGCTDLVDLDCATGNCKLRTTSALASVLCGVEVLERVVNTTRDAGRTEEEAAKKVQALLFEIKVGQETGEKELKAAQAAIKHMAKQHGAALDKSVAAASEALGKARAAFESAGLAGQKGLSRVEENEAKVKGAREEMARKVEAEREKHRGEGAAEVTAARKYVAEKKFGEARASHGSAAVAYEMAGDKATMAAQLASVLEEIVRAEEAQKALDEEEAARKRAEAEEAERKRKEEEERLRLEEVRARVRMGERALHAGMKVCMRARLLAYFGPDLTLMHARTGSEEGAGGGGTAATGCRGGAAGEGARGNSQAARGGGACEGARCLVGGEAAGCSRASTGGRKGIHKCGPRGAHGGAGGAEGVGGGGRQAT